MVLIKTNKRFDEIAPGFEREMEYRFRQMIGLVSASGSSGISAVKNMNVQTYEFNLNTQSGVVIFTPQIDEWITEIIVVCTEAFDDTPTFKIKRFDTGAYLVNDTVELEVVDTVSIKNIWTKFTAITNLILELSKGSATTGKGIIFIKTYKP